jgi:hypothetical protein
MLKPAHPPFVSCLYSFFDALRITVHFILLPRGQLWSLDFGAGRQTQRSSKITRVCFVCAIKAPHECRGDKTQCVVIFRCERSLFGNRAEEGMSKGTVYGKGFEIPARCRSPWIRSSAFLHWKTGNTDIRCSLIRLLEDLLLLREFAKRYSACPSGCARPRRIRPPFGIAA